MAESTSGNVDAVNGKSFGRSISLPPIQHPDKIPSIVDPGIVQRSLQQRTTESQSANGENVSPTGSPGMAALLTKKKPTVPTQGTTGKKGMALKALANMTTFMGKRGYEMKKLKYVFILNVHSNLIYPIQIIMLFWAEEASKENFMGGAEYDICLVFKEYFKKKEGSLIVQAASNVTNVVLDGVSTG